MLILAAPAAPAAAVYRSRGGPVSIRMPRARARVRVHIYIHAAGRSRRPAHARGRAWAGIRPRQQDDWHTYTRTDEDARTTVLDLPAPEVSSCPQVVRWQRPGNRRLLSAVSQKHVSANGDGALGHQN
eukprot:COSAG02_NODE_2177_length_9589_cov_2.871760_7_plen_128_part_00